MRLYVEAGTGFKSGKDVFGNEIVGSTESIEAVKNCIDFLKSQKEMEERRIEIIETRNAELQIEEMTPSDLLISLHINFYRESAGVGLRGFYRSTRKHNSEKCKGLAITVTKAIHDHIDMYYHGVYNEQRDKHPELNAIVHTSALAALIEVGLKDDIKDKMNDPAVHRNVGIGLAKGILRHLQAQHHP